MRPHPSYSVSASTHAFPHTTRATNAITHKQTDGCSTRKRGSRTTISILSPLQPVDQALNPALPLRLGSFLRAPCLARALHKKPVLHKNSDGCTKSCVKFQA